MVQEQCNDPGTRKGVIAGGNFLIDNVKMIDHWPRQDTLASIESQSVSNGGGPYNILKDLAVLAPGIPLEACGLVGEDVNGDWIVNDCRSAGIAVDQIHRTEESSTSYTDAMTVAATGRRTFFHQRGANARLAESHFDFGGTKAKIFFLGYLTLLDTLDQTVENGSTRAANVLRSAKQAGLLTAVDCVSAPHRDFRKIVRAALPLSDVFFLNEIEIGQVFGREVSEDADSLVAAAVELASEFLSGDGRIVLHAATGAVVVNGKGSVTIQGAVKFPEERISGATGAGDAFAAGFLLGVHNDLETKECLEYAVCVAAMSLTAPSPSDGIRSIANCLELKTSYGFRPF